MTALPCIITDRIALWSGQAQAFVHDAHRLFVARSLELGTPRLETSLKWGELAWRPKRDGTTIRISWSDTRPDQIGVFVHCQTDIVTRMRTLRPDAFEYVGNRAMWHDLNQPLPEADLTLLAEMAFCYHGARGRKTSTCGT